MNADKTMPCHCCHGTGTEINHVALGSDLREMRVRAGISLNGLARYMDISGPYLSDLERGNRKWTPDLISRFRQAVKEGGGK